MQRSEKARLALLDTGAIQARQLQHMTARLVKAFHLLRSMFATGPSVRPLQEVRLNEGEGVKVGAVGHGNAIHICLRT